MICDGLNIRGGPSIYYTHFKNEAELRGPLTIPSFATLQQDGG
jgi:hypothetical protein